MKKPRRLNAPPDVASSELIELRARLADAVGALRAIRGGEVDTVLVAGKKGQQVFTLEGAEHSYRMLIESMNEGALTLTTDTMILYANQRFARMVKSPLEQIAGSSLRRFLSKEDRATVRDLFSSTEAAGSKIQVWLAAADGSRLPVQISIQPLGENGSERATIGMVVTDMTEARHTEERLRALTRRVVEVQEAERGRLAVELHDNITQLLCGLLFQSQALAADIPASAVALKTEATSMRELLGQTADEVERITRDLRPGVLEQLGLVAALSSSSTEFAKRSGVAVKLVCPPLSARLSVEAELTLYRILQEALNNIQQHARARNVTISLIQRGEIVHLTIKDDGVGFDPTRSGKRPKKTPGLGLLGMRERATYVGGSLKIKSAHNAGMEIEVWLPIPIGDVARGPSELH